MSRNSLIFGDVDTLDYGVVIDGEAVFDAPERDVEVVTIPGRNGTLQIDNGRFENIEVTYPASIWADAHGDFKTKIRDLRNALASKRGYQRLTDTYHPDEYRLGVFKEGLECDPAAYNTAAEMELVFDCKPQRFLTSGETSVDISSAAAQSFSGNPIDIIYVTGGTVNTFESVVPPYQPNGPGSPSSYSQIYSFSSGQTVYMVPSAVNKSWTASSAVYGARVDHKAQKVYKTHDGHLFTGTENITYVPLDTTLGFPPFFRYQHSNSLTSSNTEVGYCSRFNPIAKPATAPYRALKNGDIFSDNTYIYWRYDSVHNPIDMKALLAEWYAAGEPMEYCTKRASETNVTSSVSAQVITSYTNEKIYSQAYVGNTYVNHGTVNLNLTAAVNLVNETEFEARPLLSVTGTGTVNVGDVTITIGGGGTQMYIDCDIDEAFSYSGGNMVNRNGDVSMSSTDFPSLPPGANVITFSSGITQVLVTPRWWRV